MCIKTSKHKCIIYIQPIEGTSVSIYQNKRLLKKITSYYKLITMIHYYDKIIIIANNESGIGGFTGTFIINGKTYPFIKNTFKLKGRKTNNKDTLFSSFSGGKYLGCFQDNINNRTLPNLINGRFDISECHNEAVKEGSPYYGLQNGYQCFIGYNYLNSTLLPDERCLTKCMNNNKEYCGGNTTNSIYSTIDVPTIIDYNEYKNKLLPKKNMNITPNSKWIWIEKTNVENNYILGEWKFEWIYNPETITKYCSNPNYNQFDPNGCENKTNDMTCAKTSRLNYQAEENKCSSKINPIKQLNNTFLEYKILDCLNKIPLKKDRKKIHQEFLNNYYNLYKLSCEILKQCNKTEKHLCDNGNLNIDPTFLEHCKNIPQFNRKCPDNINQNKQQCSKGSLKYELLKDKCFKNNYCFDKYADSSTIKCYLPNYDITKYLNLNDYKYFQTIKKAYMNLDNILIRQSGIIDKWKHILKDICISSKNLQFEEDISLSCPCKKSSYCHPC
jgi:hypothetical protein